MLVTITVAQLAGAASYTTSAHAAATGSPPARTVTAVFSDQPYSTERFSLTIALPAGVTYTAKGTSGTVVEPVLSATGRACTLPAGERGGCSTTLSGIFSMGSSPSDALQTAGYIYGDADGHGTTANGTIWARFREPDTSATPSYELTSRRLYSAGNAGAGYGTINFGAVFSATINETLLHSAVLRAL